MRSTRHVAADSPGRRLTAPVGQARRAEFGLLAVAAVGLGMVLASLTQTPAGPSSVAAVGLPSGGAAVGRGATAAQSAPTIAVAPAVGPAATLPPIATIAPESPLPTGTQLPAATPPPTPAPTATPGPATDAVLTALLGQLRLQSRIPGIAATIIWPDGRTWSAHAGFADLGNRVTVRTATPFSVASISKTFLAALVVQLSQEGRFGLDDPVLSHLPTANVDPTVTIRELLDHTSGVYDFFSNPTIDKAILACRTCVWTPARSLAYVKKPYFEPGTSFAYSNTNYVLLGQLVERSTGQPYASLLRQRFFGPLGLTSTYVQGMEPAPGGAIARSYRFFSYALKEKPTPLWDGTGVAPFRSLVSAAGSSGAIASSSLDLARWTRALYGGQVLGPVGLAEMLDFTTETAGPADPADPAAPAPTSPVRYGLGVEGYTIGGRDAVGHGGRLLGARAAVRYLPVEGIAIAVVMNTDRGDAAGIAGALLGVLLPPLPPPAPSPSPSGSPTPIVYAGPSRGMA